MTRAERRRAATRSRLTRRTGGFAVGGALVGFALAGSTFIVDVLMRLGAGQLVAAFAAAAFGVGCYAVLSLLRGRRDMHRAIASLDEPARTDVAGPPGQAATPPVSGPWSREAARRTVPQQPTREDRP